MLLDPNLQAERRLSHVFHRNLNSIPAQVSHGEGVYLFDSNGKEYLDACGGAAVSCLGHSDPSVIAAIKAQLDSIPYVHSGFFTTRATEELAENLVSIAGAEMKSALFFNSGSEAVEAALKLARQFHLENREPTRNHVVTRRQSYHGTTIGALAAGGLVGRQRPFSAWLMSDQISYIDACYPYRNKLEGEQDDEYSARLVSELERTILHVGAQNVAALVIESVAGATLGVVPPTPGYLSGLREVCNRHGILLILDEVMCGMGRCGDWLACHRENVEPDIVCVAKGLGGGYQPISAMIISEKVHDAISNNSGAFMHGQTYMGHATSCAASLAVISKIEQEGLIDKVAELGVSFGKVLAAEFADHPHVGQIRGRGFFWGIELVENKASKVPFSKDAKLHLEIKQQAMTNGLLVYTGGGSLQNGMGDHVLLSPPYISTFDHLKEISDKLRTSIDAALTSAQLI